MGALAGGAAGGYAGHKMNHGFLGALGGAYAGHKLEDAYKDHNKPPSPNPAPVPVASHGKIGNFSASVRNVTLDRDYDLIAECTAINGHKKLSSISLNDVLANEDGYFRWASPAPGSFGASARNVKLVDGGKFLEAELRTCNGSWRTDRISLNERIENNDGDLRLL